MTWEADRVRAAGVELARFRAGSADPMAPMVVLLHGLGHWTSAAWDRLLPELDPRWRVVALDLPGFGASARPRLRYTPAFFRRVLGAFAEAELPSRFALAGYSLGGMIAADVAATLPDRVSHLVLIAPLGVTRAPRLVARALGAHALALLPWLRPPRALLERTLQAAVVDPRSIDPAVALQARKLARDPDFVRVYASVATGALGTLLALHRIHRRWSRYTGPVLIAWGRHDRFLSFAGLAAAQRIYPQAEVLACEESAHLPMVEEPARLGEALRRFLATG